MLFDLLIAFGLFYGLWLVMTGLISIYELLEGLSQKLLRP